MRTLIRGVGAALVLAGATMLSACQRESSAPTESASAPSNAEREAEIAAEQLAALGAPANAAQRALYQGEFQASGGIDSLGSDEGAWELRLLTDYAQLARPGLGEDGGVTSERDYRERGMRVLAGPLTITIMQEACSTASGVALPYVAHVLFEGVAYQGCARRGIDEGARATWASVLPELIPAIDACLARVTSRPARVTFATAIDEGAVSVRIREADGSRRECIADGGGESVSVYESVSDLDRRSGEGDPEFHRGVNQPRGESCRTAEPAIDRSGEQLGWLIRRSC
jgi:uncharacterized membrane protein